MMSVNETWAKEQKDWEHLGKDLYCGLKKKISGRIIRADYRSLKDKPSKQSLGEWNTFKAMFMEAQKLITIFGENTSSQ